MRGVLGAFRELDATVSAIEALKKRNVGIIRVYTPTPRHELEEAIVAPPSPVRRFTLIGGLAGVTFGYWIAIWTSDYWPLVVGGKPIASWVPYTIFGFEVMVLIGGLSTVVGLLIAARVPRLTMQVGYDPRFSHGDYGRKYFRINCAVCHGDRAVGDGPATGFGMPGINLTSDVTKSRTDGYIFGMIRNGRGLMPPYNRIEEMDRWDVVNYVRALQGVSGKTVAVGPLAAPGVTGDKVPGPTKIGPNRPAPFYNPRDVLPAGQQPATHQGAQQQGLPTIPTDSNARVRTDTAKARPDSLRARVIR